MKLIKTKESSPIGEYKTTVVDQQKEVASFSIEAANGGSYTVNPRTLEIKGRGVKFTYDNGFIEVTEARLKSLQKTYTWVTNF